MHNGRLFSKALFLFYIKGNVVINPLPVCLVQNFVAHSRIQLAFHVYITSAPHILHCFCKMTHVDHTGIIRATDKKHGHFRSGAVPVLYVVSTLHQLKKCQIAIICKRKATKFRIGVLPELLPYWHRSRKYSFRPCGSASHFRQRKGFR